MVELPDPWPACRRPGCGSTAAAARIDAPYDPVAIVCENGHHRASRPRDDFRPGGRYPDLFGPGALGPSRRGRRDPLDPGERRRSEVREDATCCALCGTPPAEHPQHPDLDLRDDAAIWAWLARYRPDAYAQVREAIAIAARVETVTLQTWRTRIPPALREIVVAELASSELAAHHLVPLERLAQLTGVLTARELAFAVQRLLVAMCRRCADARRLRDDRREAFIGDYVRALHGGDERLARADAVGWRTMEIVASHAAQLRLSIDRPA